MPHQIGSTVAPCGVPRDGELSLASREYVDPKTGYIVRRPIQTCRAPGPAARETADRMHARWLRLGLRLPEDVSPEELAGYRAAYEASRTQQRAQTRAERDAVLVGTAVAAAIDATSRKRTEK